MFKIGIGILLFGILLACAHPGSWLAFVAILIGLVGLFIVVGSAGDEKSRGADESEESNVGDAIEEQE